MKKIQVNSTNKNDLVKIFGEPSTKSSFDNDVWIYIERKISNTHFLGKRELVVNNVLVLEIDERGLLAKVEFYDIEDMNKLKLDPDKTEISYKKKSFVYVVGKHNFAKATKCCFKTSLHKFSFCQININFENFQSHI